MPLLKERPKVYAVFPSYAHPGDEIDAEVHVESAQDLDVRRLTCRLRGEERSTEGSANPLDRRTICLQEAVFLEGGTIPSGHSSYPMTFRVPQGVPPSHRLDRFGARVSYHLEASIDIPWWPDLHTRFALRVEHPPVAVQDDPPLLRASHVDGPSGTDPYVEFILSAHRVVPGGTVEGKLALGNTRHNQLESARVSLVATEICRGSVNRERMGAKAHSMTLDVGSLGDGDATPFALTVPEDIAQSFDSELWAVRWKLEIKLLETHGRHLRVSAPITVLPKGSTVLQPEDATAPMIGDGRTATIWGELATSLGLAFDRERTTMTTHRGDVTVRIFREHRGADGLCSTAELEYPGLGLGIAGGPTRDSTVDHPARVRLGDPEWDERHVIVAREHRQLRKLLTTPLSHALLPLHLSTFDDEELILYHRDPGQNHEPLHRFVHGALAVADALTAARGQIPAPASMAAMVTTWERLAERLGASLTLGDMSIRGRWEGVAMRVATLWTDDGDIVGTRLWRTDPGVVSEDQTLLWREGRLEHGDLARLSKPARAAFDRALTHARELEVGRDRLVVVDERGPIDDEALLIELITRLDQLAAALRGSTGPYR